MDFKFFLENNKSGYKTKTSWLIKNNNELYNSIINFNKSNDLGDIPFKQMLYNYFHNITKKPKCINCDKEVSFKGNLNKGYSEFCSLKCFNSNKKEMIERQKKVFNDKYGVDFYVQTDNFYEKVKKIKENKYGDVNYNNINKSKETKKERYGNENYNNIEKIKETNLNKYNVEYYPQSEDYKIKKFNKFKEKYPYLNIIKNRGFIIECKCEDCNKTFETNRQLIYERDKKKTNQCTICNNLYQGGSSNTETILKNKLNNNNIDFISNFRLNNKEIDILIGKLGIEVNGLYWHSNKFLDNNYHLEKTNFFKNNGYNIIHFFEDEINNKLDIVSSIIKNKLNKTENIIYGRKCEIKEVSHKETKLFLDSNHIQGSCGFSKSIGLYYSNELVSVMTFSKGRKSIGAKKDEWELSRFCNKINYSVIGGASKLFKHFLKYNDGNIMTFSDNRLYGGDLYYKLGFNKVKEVPPGYFYVKNEQRYHRYRFRKSELIKMGYDPNKTEKQIMQELNYLKIYDCGNTKFIYKN